MLTLKGEIFKMTGELNLSRDAKRLWQIASEVAEETRRKFGSEFTKPMQGLGENGVFDIIDMITEKTFASEHENLAKSQVSLGEGALVTAFKEELLNKLKKCYEED